MKPLIVIVGVTASGKSSLAMKIAKQFNGEIINADSWSVYKGFDIGTAKPSLSDRKEVKHYLLDVADPADGYSAAIYKRNVMQVIERINASNKIPVLVGGTGLYIDSIIFDYGFLPPSNKDVRDKYNSMSLIELQELLKSKDYDISDIDINNKRRVIRLIENSGEKPKSKPLRSNTLIIGIDIDQETLKNNIEKRVEKMFNEGLEKEVKSLYETYGWDIEPMKGIGYREFNKYFSGHLNLQQTKELIIMDSIKLAKKQRTWFKRNNSIQWVNNRSNIVEIVTTFLNKLNV